MAADSQPGEASSKSLPIASLDPSRTLPQDRTLTAEVALLWPYSSSTRRAALLITEPDFRLRRHKGQVRVQLHGAAAAAVGPSRIAIGDHVELSLSGATWAAERAAVTAPGRAVDGVLLFDRELHLKIVRDGVVLKSIDVHEPRSVSPVRKPASPPSSSSRLPSSQITSTSLTSPASWASPAFLRRKEERFRPAIRPAFTAQEDPLPFSTDEMMQEELDNQKPRKRTKFGRKSGEWTFAREGDSPDYAQHDLTGMFDVEMIEREIDAEEGRKRGSPARSGREERKGRNQDRYSVPDFGLDGASASIPRPFVEAERFERIVKESRPAALKEMIAEHVTVDEHQATQETFSAAPEQVVADVAESDVNVVQAEGLQPRKGSIDVADEVEDRGDKASIISEREAAKLTEETEIEINQVQDHDRKDENEHDLNDDDEDEHGDVDENQDDTNDETTNNVARITQRESPEEQQSQIIDKEGQEVTIARPQTPTMTVTEEVSQANAQLHAELASQLKEPDLVDGDQIRTDDAIEAPNAPEDHDETLQTSEEIPPPEPHAETPPVISEIPQVAQVDRDTMDQDVTVDRSNELLGMPHEVNNVLEVSSGADSSSIEQRGLIEETAENRHLSNEDNLEAEVPVVVTPQLKSAEVDVEMTSEQASTVGAHDETGDGLDLEDNTPPVVINEDESSPNEVLESEEQPTSDAVMQEQDHVSRSLDDVVESVMEVAATEEVAKAVLTMPVTEWTLQPSPAFEAQSNFGIASPVMDSTALSMDEPNHQEEPIEFEQSSGPANEAQGSPEEISLVTDHTDLSKDESNHWAEPTEPETSGESQEELASVASQQHQEEATSIADVGSQAESMLDAGDEPASTVDQREDVAVDTTNDIMAETARLGALTDEQLLQEGQSFVSKLIENDQQEAQMPGQRGATLPPLSVDTPMVMSDEQMPHEPPAHRLSAFEVMQSRLSRPVSQEEAIPPLLPDNIEHSTGSSSEEEMQEDEKEPSVVVSLLDDSSDHEDDQVEYDDIPSVAEAASSFSSKDSEESFTGFDDEERPDAETATVDQDSVLGSEIDERPDPDLASFQEEPFAEFEDEDENEGRLTPDSGSFEGAADENGEEYGVYQNVNEDMHDVEYEATPANGTVEAASPGQSVKPRLHFDEDKNEDDEVSENVYNAIAEEDLESQGKDNVIFEDDDEDEVLPELELHHKKDEEYETHDMDENMGGEEKEAALPASRTAERAALDEPLKIRLRSAREVDEDMYEEELNVQDKDNDMYEDEDDVLPELDFSQIPTLEKPLVAGLSAINDPALAPLAEDNDLPALQDQDEETHSRITGTDTGAKHARSGHASDDTGHQHVNGNSTHREAMLVEQDETDLQFSKPLKKSSSRKSNVPSELKGWFSPRESLQDGYKNDITSFEKEVEGSHVERMDKGLLSASQPSRLSAGRQAQAHSRHEKELAAPSSSAPVAGSRQIKHPGRVPQRFGDEALKLAGGLQTSLSYYTPLTNLQIHTNSQSEHDSTVDVLAVVSSFTAKAKRATSGPKDHFTTFHITTPTPKSDFSPVEVQVFRPRKEVLPVADVGDVALLRNFVVRSNNGKSFLLSTAGSAWCVWRYAKKERLVLKNVGEECMGPPVEVGVEERARAQELSSWWQNEKANEADTNARPVFRWSWRASD